MFQTIKKLDNNDNAIDAGNNQSMFYLTILHRNKHSI